MLDTDYSFLLTFLRAFMVIVAVLKIIIDIKVINNVKKKLEKTLKQILEIYFKRDEVFLELSFVCVDLKMKILIFK